MTISAISAMRNAVQSSTATNAKIGQPAGIDALVWLGIALGYRWPNSYLNVLAKHDGAFAGGSEIYSISQRIAILLIFRERFRSIGYWPVGGDGCGNYYVLLTKEIQSNECPVLFLEGSQDYLPTEDCFASYADFVIARVL